MRTGHIYICITGLLAAALMLPGCNKVPLEPPGPVPAERVLLMYDNIGEWFNDDVAEAGEAVAAGALDPAERMVVFHRGFRTEDYTGTRSVVYELVRDASQSRGFRREMLKVYEQGENATLSKEVINAVVGDVRTAVPAPHYGFAFGSHGKGWIFKDNTTTIARSGASPGVTSQSPFAELWDIPENPQTRFFQGYGQELDVSEFIDALDEWNWDFILLDDCFMASVESLYDMRTLADYFIASPTEIIIQGFPYDRVVSTLFEEWENDLESCMADVADGFVEAYRAGIENPELPHATVAVVKSSEMESLAGVVRDLNLQLNELDSVDGIQYYELISNPAHLFYDLDDYLNRIRANTAPTEYNAFKTQLERTVVFRANTDTFYSGAFRNKGEVPVTHFSGLAVFIPWSRTAAFIPDYRRTGWYQAVYAE